jgi:ribonuclease D
MGSLGGLGGGLGGGMAGMGLPPGMEAAAAAAMADPAMRAQMARLMADPAVIKLFHFARFDVAVLQHSLGITVAPSYCTKIAAKLVRTFTDRHGLKDLCKELLGVDLSKQQQTSDWGATELTSEQLAYAASDVVYLHRLWEKLDALLVREGRRQLAQECFDFLPTRGRLDLLGYEEPDVFHH